MSERPSLVFEDNLLPPEVCLEDTVSSTTVMCDKPFPLEAGPSEMVRNPIPFVPSFFRPAKQKLVPLPSNASSGYESCRESKLSRFSQLSFLESIQSSDGQTALMQDSSMPRMKELAHDNHHGRAADTRASLANAGFRPRSCSLPTNAKELALAAKCRAKEGSITSSQSDGSSDPESHVATKSSIRTCVSTEIKLPLKELQSDISKSEHTSYPFPSSSNGQQYQLRLCFNEESCTSVYLDVLLKKETASTTHVQVPPMEVSISLLLSSADCNQVEKPDELLVEDCKVVSASCHKITKISKEKYVNIIFFPNLVDRTQLEKNRKCPQKDLVTKLTLKY